LIASSNTTRTALKYNAITHLEMLYIVAYFDNLSYDFVTWIGMGMHWESCGCDAEVPINIDCMKVAPANTCQTITHAYPVCGG
jgi:hypothetical protein